MTQKIKQKGETITLGHNLKKFRYQLHLTQDEIAVMMQLQGFNISRSIYSQMEAGTYNIRISELIALKEIFHIDFNTIFEGITLPECNF